MRYSEHYNLYLPEGSDFVTPEQYNANFETLDGKLKEMEAGVAPKAHTHGFSDLSGVAAASHQHGIGDLAGVAAAGHKHSAGDVTSGVFDIARIPIQLDGDRVVTTIGEIDVQRDISGGTAITQTCPFVVGLAARPRRVRLMIVNNANGGSNWESKGGILHNSSGWAIIDMAYSASERLDAYVEAPVGGGTNGTPSFARLFLRDITNKTVFDMTGNEDGKTWNGFGGHAIVAKTNTASSKLAWLQIKNFVYTNTGVTFTIEAKHPAGSDVSSLIFCVYGHVFN